MAPIWPRKAAACHSRITAEEESNSAELKNSWIAALASDSAELKRHIFWSHLHSSLSPDCITVSSCISNEFQIMKCGRAFHNREIWHKVQTFETFCFLELALISKKLWGQSHRILDQSVSLEVSCFIALYHMGWFDKRFCCDIPEMTLLTSLLHASSRFNPLV